jgi:hypothetical protein
MGPRGRGDDIESDATPSFLPECAVHLVGERLHQIGQQRAFAGRDEYLDRHARQQPRLAEPAHFGRRDRDPHHEIGRAGLVVARDVGADPADLAVDLGRWLKLTKRKVAGWPNFTWSISCGGNRETKNSRKVYAQEFKTKATVSIRWMRIAFSGLRRLQKAFHLQCGLNIGPRRDAVLEGHQTFQAGKIHLVSIGPA